MAYSPIKLISFDLDDTLWDGKNLIRSAHQAMLDSIIANNPTLHSDQLNTLYFSLRETVLAQHAHLQHHLSFIRKETLCRIFMRLEFSREAAEIHANDAFNVFYHARNRVSFFPHALNTLRSLKQHYRLAALTNGNANPMATGLQDYLEFFISAEQIGSAKPAPEIFAALLEKSDVQPEQCVHIGDHPHWDVIAAKQVGMKSIWFNPEGKTWTESTLPDQVFSDYARLEYLIKKLH